MEQQKFGDYNILGPIGKGGMGLVYRALEVSLDREVAIKFVDISKAGNAAQLHGFRERLRREGQAVAKLDHPNIVKVHRLIDQDELCAIVMEFVDGEGLDSFLAGRNSEPHVVLGIIGQAAAALDYAHSQGVVHRDIKPSNILIRRGDRVVKLVDFGVAKLTASRTLTQTGTTLGTPQYMSPEQVKGANVDARSDQYSLAVCAYEMLTAKSPFPGESLETLFYNIISNEPVPASQLNPSLGIEIEGVLNQALSKQPEARFRNCSEFFAFLRDACAQTPSWRPTPAFSKAASSSAGGIAVETPVPHPLVRADDDEFEPWISKHFSAVAPAPARYAPQPQPGPRGLAGITAWMRQLWADTQPLQRLTIVVGAAIVIALAIMFAVIPKPLRPKVEAPRQEVQTAPAPVEAAPPQPKATEPEPEPPKPVKRASKKTPPATKEDAAPVAAPDPPEPEFAKPTGVPPKRKQ